MAAPAGMEPEMESSGAKWEINFKGAKISHKVWFSSLVVLFLFKIEVIGSIPDFVATF